MNEYLTNRQKEILKKGYDGVIKFYNTQPLLSLDFTDLANRKLINLVYGEDENHVGGFSDTAHGKALVDYFENEQKEKHNKSITTIKSIIFTAFIGFIFWIIEQIIIA